jgi:hypothetical protein
MRYKNRLAADPGAAPSTTLKPNNVLVHTLVICVHLLILVLLYSQTYFFDYVHFDDVGYVLMNSAVSPGLTLEGIQWAFTNVYMSNWHPLTWVSHMLDVSLFGFNPGWAHLHNMVLHGANSLLVYVFLQKLSGSWGKACILSLVFLVHPLHVESVAWIAERKDLLCAFFFLFGLLVYDSYRARPGRLRYSGVLIAYALALMAKPMAVTFPIVLLILDFFVYRRHSQIGVEKNSIKNLDYFRAIVEKLPFLVLAAVIGVVTIIAQDNSLIALETQSISSRWTTATTAYFIYLKQFFLPIGLVAYYPITESTSPIDMVFLSLLLLILVALAANLAKRYPLIATGLCWYLITLLPVIGLIQVGSQAHADRYMYLPSVGVLISCIYLLPSRGKKYSQMSTVISIIFLAYLTIISYWQISYWENRNSLWSRVLDVLGPTYKAHIHLVDDYKQRGMLHEARQHSEAARSIDSNLPGAYIAMGNLALEKREFEQAEKLYRLALDKGGSTAELLNNFGIAMAEQGHTNGAIAAFEESIRIDPTRTEAKINLGRYRIKQKQEGTE